MKAVTCNLQNQLLSEAVHTTYTSDDDRKIIREDCRRMQMKKRATEKLIVFHFQESVTAKRRRKIVITQASGCSRKFFFFLLLGNFRARSFGIFRNKNIVRNIFRLFCSWKESSRMEIQVFRNENSSQTNAYTHYSNYSYFGLISTERTRRNHLAVSFTLCLL